MKINEKNRNIVALYAAFAIVVGAVAATVWGSAAEVVRAVEVRRAQNAWVLP